MGHMNTTHSPGHSRLHLILALAAGLSCAGLGLAQTTTVTTTREVRPGSVELKHVDRDFFEKAAKASMSEVEISRVAAMRSTNPDVKQFAQMMIADHGGASDELALVASSKGVSLPAKDMHPNRWEKHDAKDFDKDYINKMVSDHEDVVKLFEKQAKDGNDPEAVAFARKYLPKLQHHLQAATDLKRMLK